MSVARRGGLLRTVSVAVTDVGRKRLINEDAYFADDGMGFYVVADGVGGHNKGEVASREAIDQLKVWVYGARADLDRLVARSRARRLRGPLGDSAASSRTACNRPATWCSAWPSSTPTSAGCRPPCRRC